MGHELTFSTVKSGVEKGGDLEAFSTLHHHPFIGVGGGGGDASEAASRVEVENRASDPHGCSPMIPIADRWGPFTPDLDIHERVARCRCLRAVVHLTTGPRGETATRLLRVAERNPAALPDAARALNAMDATDKRHVWASYARLSRSV